MCDVIIKLNYLIIFKSQRLAHQQQASLEDLQQKFYEKELENKRKIWLIWFMFQKTMYNNNNNNTITLIKI